MDKKRKDPANPVIAAAAKQQLDERRPYPSGAVEYKVFGEGQSLMRPCMKYAWIRTAGRAGKQVMADISLAVSGLHMTAKGLSCCLSGSMKAILLPAHGGINDLGRKYHNGMFYKSLRQFPPK